MENNDEEEKYLMTLQNFIQNSKVDNNIIEDETQEF